MRKGTVALGRIADMRALPYADRIAIAPGERAFSDHRFVVYPSRKALEAFLRNPGLWVAIVKNTVPRNMLIYPAFQAPE